MDPGGSLRGQAALLTTELVAVLACAIVPLPVPAQVPLLIMAMISYGIRGKLWSARFESGGLRWAIGAITGAVALAIAVVVIGPLLEHRTGGLVGWTRHGMVRGKPEVFLGVAIVVGATAAATELVLRGWILERMIDQVRGRAGLVVAIAVTALIEAVFTAGPGWSGPGAALFGAALSALYLGSGRSLVAPLAARLTFELGVVLLEALKLVD